MREIGMMGGAFNPIHTRHLMVAQSALDQFNLERVLFVPSGEPPHKKADLLAKELRFEMVAAAVADNPQFEASRIEIDRPGITWTIDTLKELKDKYGAGVRINFIIGEDNLPILRDYNRRAELLSLCRLLVSPRETASPAQLAEWKRILPEADIEIIDCPANFVSSTLIRTWIRGGKSVKYLVNERVHRILVDRRHYLEPLPPKPPKVRLMGKIRKWLWQHKTLRVGWMASAFGITIASLATLIASIFHAPLLVLGLIATVSFASMFAFGVRSESRKAEPTRRSNVEGAWLGTLFGAALIISGALTAFGLTGNIALFGALFLALYIALGFELGS